MFPLSQAISTPTFKMENTTDYYDYSVEPVTPASPCSRDNDNFLGAQLSFIYYFMFLLSLYGNGLVLFIIYRFEKLTTVSNILLLNLVFSSLIFMSSLPFLGVYMQLQNWIFGSVMCKLVGSVYYLGLYSSVLFLALLTFDRHLTVVYSLGLRQVRNTNYALVSCFVVWLVSGLACISPMILQNAFVFRISNTTYCEDHPFNLDPTFVYHLRTSTYYMQFFLFFIFPLVVIVYCYVRIAITVMSSRIVIKVKTVRLIFIIVLLFFICWAPYNIHLLMSSENSSCEEMQRRGYVRHITRNIAYFYFFISPIFYTFVGRKFQNHFRQLLVRRFPKLKKHISVSENSRTNISTKGTHASTGNPNARLNSATVDFSSDTYLPPLTLPVHDRLQPTCINHNANRFPIQSKIVSGWYSNQPHTYC